MKLLFKFGIMTCPYDFREWDAKSFILYIYLYINILF